MEHVRAGDAAVPEDRVGSFVAVGLLLPAKRLKIDLGQIESGERRETAAAPLDAPSGATAPQDGPNQPSPKATAPHLRPQTSRG